MKEQKENLIENPTSHTDPEKARKQKREIEKLKRQFRKVFERKIWDVWFT